MATEEITISELELADEVLADMTLPVDTATETRAVTLKQLRAWLGSSLPTGFIIPAVGKISDERFTLLDGKTLSRAGTYEAFCNKVVSEVQAGNWFACSEDEYNSDISTYGQCGKFVVSNDYIRIPKITRFIGATITLSEIGKTYKERLPNIKGTMVGDISQANATGALKLTNAYDGAMWQGSTSVGRMRDWELDASLSSSTYKDGAKVQPDHTKYPYYMVISTEGQTANIEIDINKIYEDLNIKANTDFSNVASNIDYVIQSYQNGTNWYRIYKSGWVEQGGRFTSSGTSFQTISLLVSMKDTNYIMNTTCLSGYASASSSTHNYVMGKAGVVNPSALATTYFQVYFETSGNTISWRVSGKKA